MKPLANTLTNYITCILLFFISVACNNDDNTPATPIAPTPENTIVTNPQNIANGEDIGGVTAMFNEVYGSAALTVNGNTYLFTTSASIDDVISSYRIVADGTLELIGHQTHDGGDILLGNPQHLTIATIGENYFVCVAAQGFGAIQVFQVATETGVLSPTGNIVDDGDLYFNGVIAVTTINHPDGNTYIYAGGYENGISGFLLENNGTIGANVVNMDHEEGGNTDILLNSVFFLETFIKNDKAYVLVAARDSDALTLFEIANGGGLIHQATIEDDTEVSLDEVRTFSLHTTSNGTTYLYVGGADEDNKGMSIFTLNEDASFTYITTVNQTNNDAVPLTNIGAIHTFSFNGYNYIAATHSDNTFTNYYLSLFVREGNTLIPLKTITDTDERYLNNVFNISSLVSDTNVYIYTPGRDDDGLSVFNLFINE